MEIEIGNAPALFTLENEECDYLTEECFKERQKEEKDSDE